MSTARVVTLVLIIALLGVYGMLRILNTVEHGRKWILVISVVGIILGILVFWGLNRMMEVNKNGEIDR